MLVRVPTFLMCLFILGASAIAEVRFNRDIRPILSDKCFACHGPDSKQVAGDLRLDVREAAVAAGAIVPAKPEQSELIARIFSDDEDTVMPPADQHKRLTTHERELLKKWIAQGADYELHWAYTPVRPAPEMPAENIVDFFIDQRLQETGTAAVPPADRTTLIRRLSLDLTGIPPTPDEVDAFVLDSSADAYEKLVERLLSSTRYGERLAEYWLDLVRYADTVGYHGDQEVSQWAYRDYVIRAFNENLPYDQFVREQLAGDLLPEPTTEQLIASGYNRLNQTTEEGGSQAKEYLAIYFADRVRNVSQVFMGSTLGCAQCHDHKYDPFTTKDFYSFGAFFADLEERGVYGGRGSRPPVLQLPTDEHRLQIAEIETAIQETMARRDDVRKDLLAGLAHWKPEPAVSRAWVDDVQVDNRTYSGDWNFVSAPDAPVKHGQASRRQSGEGVVQHFFMNAKDQIAISAHTELYAWVYLDPKNPPTSIMLQFNVNGDWSHRAVWGSDDIDFGKQEKSWAGYQRMGELPALGEWVRLSVAAEQVGLYAPAQGKQPEKKSNVGGMAFTQFGGTAWWDQAGWVDSLPAEVLQALNMPEEERSAEQTKQLTDFYLSTSSVLTDIDRQVNQLQAKLKRVQDSIPTTVVSRAVEPRMIRILPRGNWMDDSGDVVEPKIPEFLGQIESQGKRLTRLDLANWLTRDDNPLTARTMVNRLWSRFFGRGICASVDDFGGQGTFPSHPDLLDALAHEFVESGWDIKHVIRLIVNSRAYQRVSTPSAKLIEADPYNELFARQGRFRVDAEVVRDSALAISGLLVEQVGGPSARPYQPAGYYAQLNFPRREYVADTNENQYRRAVYTHWQRTFLHPMLKAFDAPSREECTAQRPRSSTPLQSLVLLNDPTFVEAARSFAERILQEGGTSDADRCRWAYRMALSHSPEPEILEELLALHERHHATYEQDIAAADQLLSIGLAPVPDKIDRADLAAWTSVARTILNLHEYVTRY